MTISHAEKNRQQLHSLFMLVLKTYDPEATLISIKDGDGNTDIHVLNLNAEVLQTTVDALSVTVNSFRETKAAKIGEVTKGEVKINVTHSHECELEAAKILTKMESLLGPSIAQKALTALKASLKKDYPSLDMEGHLLRHVADSARLPKILAEELIKALESTKAER